MIKGCQKKIIMINDTGSDMFEQAYFIVKDEAQGAVCSKNDMIREANRIIENNLLAPYFSPVKRKSLKKSAKNLVFFLGMVCGAGFIGILWAVVSLA